MLEQIWRAVLDERTYTVLIVHMVVRGHLTLLMSSCQAYDSTPCYTVEPIHTDVLSAGSIYSTVCAQAYFMVNHLCAQHFPEMI